MTNNLHESFTPIETQESIRIDVICPLCKNHTFGLGHLLKYIENSKPYEVGPWECNSCHEHFNFQLYKDKSVKIKQVERDIKYLPFITLLKSTHDNPIYLIVKDNQHVKQGEDVANYAAYWFNEHTCPTNWIKNVEVIIFEEDTDPHGVFQFVRTISKDKVLQILQKEDKADEWHDINFSEHVDTLFPEVLGGTDIEGEVLKGFETLLINNGAVNNGY